MKQLKFFEEVFFGWLIALLTALTLSAVYSWQHTQYIAYTFFISWGVLFLYYIIKVRNYYSLLLIAFTMGAAGVYLTLTDVTVKAEAALLIGRIGLTIFAVMLAYRLFKNREELGSNNIYFLVLLVLLVFQILIQNIKEVDALSVGGFIHYITVGIIANIMLNGHLSKILNSGEKACLVMIAVSSLYNISIMLIANFS
jgi:hypothetical protein